MTTLSVTSKKRTGLWRRLFQIELTVVFVGLVVYAVLASINQRTSLFVIMIASLTVGNFLIPLQVAGRRLYVARRFPWNWVVFFPIQLMVGVICAVGAILFCANIAPGKFVTFFYAVLDADARTLAYENAGHSPGLLLRSDGTTETLRGGGAVLGALPDWTYQDYTAHLQPGDQLLLSTDGITEAKNADLEEFGDERLLEAARARDRSVLEIQRTIMQQVTAFCGGNFHDDATLLLLRIS